MNKNVVNAISILEEEVLKTLRKGALQPAAIASILGTEVFRKSPNTGGKRMYNPLVRGILWGLERKGFVKQNKPNAPWELTDLGKRRLLSVPQASQPQDHS